MNLLKMANSLFHFKQFTIRQDGCAMKVGTDGVLLGAWTPVESVRHILDVGTGTGLIALMLAQRSPAAITALEIDESSARQAHENVIRSPWSSRVEVVCADFRTFVSDNKYDSIVSNPPYFVGSLKSPNEQRNTARHDSQLNYSDLLQGVKRLLSPHGAFTLIIPTITATKVTTAAYNYGLFPFRRLDVITKPGGTAKRTLIAFSFFKQKCSEEVLLTEISRRQYTDKYITLIKDYFLNV
ncbi:tRNA1(Val) (adenine(37)-N6)-methyltransferase [termite gut metagenome]|uniref:tRNA1(Val) (Adenine(37)-N6)-methyltransferase n=1 Tax=termite gut metagenome TaxID=433724 RepID=A0A5J4SCK2_9ZZZZ